MGGWVKRIKEYRNYQSDNRMLNNKRSQDLLNLPANSIADKK